MTKKKLIRRPKKISDSQLWQALDMCGGLFSKTVAYIKEEWGIELTRQAVHERAHAQPERLKAIDEKELDLAESVIMRNMKQAVNLPVSNDAAKYYLNNKGVHRGYIRRQLMDITSKGEKIGQTLDLTKLTEQELKQLDTLTAKMTVVPKEEAA